jgi:hypothetical protein
MRRGEEAEAAAASKEVRAEATGKKSEELWTYRSLDDDTPGPALDGGGPSGSL